MNQCGACGEDFASVAAFDAHRVGKHAYTYSQGVKFDPPVEDGRRCLSVEEIANLGYLKNSSNRWYNPESAERVRAHFAREDAPTDDAEAL